MRGQSGEERRGEGFGKQGERDNERGVETEQKKGQRTDGIKMTEKQEEENMSQKREEMCRKEQERRKGKEKRVKLRYAIT